MSSRRYCKLCFEKNGQKHRMEEIGDREICPQCKAEFSVNTGVLLNKSALERAEKDGSPRVIPHRVMHHKRPPSSMDPVRFRTGGGGFGVGGARGSGRDRLDTWETPSPIRKRGRERTPRQSIGRFPQKPDFDIFHNRESYRVIITLPYHKDPEDIRCAVIDGALIVESLIEGFDFLQKFSLPEDVLPSSLETSLKNSILDIRFSLKKEERSEPE